MHQGTWSLLKPSLEVPAGTAVAAALAEARRTVVESLTGGGSADGMISGRYGSPARECSTCERVYLLPVEYGGTLHVCEAVLSCSNQLVS